MATGRDFDYVTINKLGCREVSGGHQMRGFYIDGCLIARTMRSHSAGKGGTITKTMLQMMAHQMHCSLKLWKTLLACPGTLEDYVQELLDAKKITMRQYRIALHLPVDKEDVPSSQQK